jgi:hypothetical protein
MTRRQRIVIFAAIALIGCSTLLLTKVTFLFHDDIEGLFILAGEKGAWFEMTDDLTPEDAPRLLWGKPLYPFRSIVASTGNNKKPDSRLDFRWNKREGRGFIRSNWIDGRKLVINLGRFRESNGKYPSGLFIGGGLPPSDPDYQFLNNEATGMTFFDGKRWFHVWCNVNEGILSPSAPFLTSYPSDWEFAGSWIRENDGTNLTIESKHHLILAGVPLDLNRLLFYTSGNTYVILTTEITNRGTTPSSIQYLYGDEPWIGDFGSSAGDVGWSEHGLLLTEQEVDVKQNTFIGMFDYGNPLAGEAHHFTGIANFIEWNRDEHERPDKAYVSNFSGGTMHGSKPMPLVSSSNRVIGLKWGPRTLNPGESLHFSIAVGMADNDPKTGMPVKPKTGLNR